jgi:hypothetical protein
MICCKTTSSVTDYVLPSEDELFKAAYIAGDYKKALEYLENGASGFVNFDDGKLLLFEVYQKYNKGDRIIDAIFDFYLTNSTP